MMPKAFALQGLGRNEEALQVMNRMPPPSPEAPPRIALLDVFFRGTYCSLLISTRNLLKLLKRRANS